MAYMNISIYAIYLYIHIFQSIKLGGVSLALEYMSRYPNYKFIKVSGSFAVCENLETFL